MKTKSTTPFESFFRPTCQLWAVRTVKSSSDGEGSSGKTATTTWFEVCSSKARSFASSRSATSFGTTAA